MYNICTVKYNYLTSGNQWSLTVEGSHNTNEKRLISDIEMQLLLKNNLEGATSNHHSWKLTVTGEAENTG